MFTQSYVVTCGTHLLAYKMDEHLRHCVCLYVSMDLGLTKRCTKRGPEMRARTLKQMAHLCLCVVPRLTPAHPYETHESFRHPHKTTCGLKLGAFTKLALSIIYSENLSQVAMSITHSMGVCSQLWGVYADLSMLSDSASYSIASSSFFICRVCSHTSITYRNMPRSTHMTVELLKYLE